MTGVGAATETLYLLPTLESVLGISLTLNLAYLNISKFEYISIVRNTLSDKLQKLDSNVKQNVKDTEWYQQLDDLSSVETLDLEWPNWNKQWVKAPGIWGALYNFFFYWRIGRSLSIVSVLYALTLLIVGVGQQSSATAILIGYFNENIGRHYFWSAVSAVWPIISIVVGRYVRIAASRFVKYQTDSLKQTARTDAERAVAALDQEIKKEQF